MPMPGAKSGPIPATGPLPATVPAVLDACVTALDQFGPSLWQRSCNRRLNLPTVFLLTSCESNHQDTLTNLFALARCEETVFAKR